VVEIRLLNIKEALTLQTNKTFV